MTKTYPHQTRTLRFLTGLLVLLLASHGLPGFFTSVTPVQAQTRRVIVVNAEQPNLWTLEQAHYLLAQMHRRNLDLRAKSLEELDPNEIAGLRFDVMRMLVEFGATFNQADLASNRLLSTNRTFNAERRQELLNERDGLRRESVALAGDIEALETEKASTEDHDAQKVLEANIAAKTTRLARVDKEIETLNGELATLNAPSGNPTATTGGATFDASKLPKSDFDDAFKAAAARQIEKFNQSPQLNASLKLDNFLQMQYEIISKQLSLLRDEVGPGERLVFLEMPQTINAAHHESAKKWAQSWWKIAGYTKRVPVAPALISNHRVDENNKPITTVADVNSIIRGDTINVLMKPDSIPGPPCPAPFNYIDPNGITIPAPGAAAGPSNRYPSTINVSGQPGTVKKVTVTLNNLSHASPDDLDLLLVGPDGQNAMLISDVGGTTPVANVTLKLDSEASHSLLDNGPLVAGTFKPTNIGPATDVFYLPVQAGPIKPLSAFKGIDPNGPWSLYVMDGRNGNNGSISSWNLEITTDCAPPKPIFPPAVPMAYKDEFLSLEGNVVPAASALSAYVRSAVNASGPTLDNRSVRTVELIPRQSSLNVNDMKLNVKAGALNFVFSTLFGFGSQLKAQRQREQFSQFVQQELYSAAFGKGAREFGWTFTPMPGTDRLNSGVRTTYAVVVVPDEATSLVLEANGCYFPRSSYQPNNFADTLLPDWNVTNRTSRNCSGRTADGRVDTKAFVVPIPAARLNGGNEFWVEKINFQNVAKGKRIVVSIAGKNFSPQIGALINGFPLVHSIGLAQPLIRDDSATGRAAADDLKEAEIAGRIERIDADKVLLTFKMPPEFQGTPTITLIAPGRATDINFLPNVDINEVHNTRLADYPKKMFGHGPGPDAFRIDRVRVFRSLTPGRLIAQVSGAGFVDSGAGLPLVLANGKSPTSSDFFSPSLLTIEFATPADDMIKIVLVSRKSDLTKVETIESDSVANPDFLSIADVELITYEAPTEDEPTATLVVKITGTGFTDNLRGSVGGKAIEVAVKSATEAILTIDNPKAASVVTLEDELTKQKVKVVVTRKAKSGP